MGIQEYLTPQGVQIGLREKKKKKQIIQEITDLAMTHPALTDFSGKDVFKALWNREKLGTTGFGQGLAIPHCSLDGLESFVLGAVIAPEGVDFEALDGEPTQIMFYIIGPPNQRNQHIKLLSSLSKSLKNKEVRQSLLSAADAADLRERIIKGIDYHEEQHDSQNYCQFIIHVQKEEIFEDVLQLISSEVEGAISVIETNNAGFYLNRMPLFSSYWSDRDQRFNRIILAVVEKPAMNNLIRRIHTDFDETEKNSGLLITVNDLLYSSGHLDF